MQPRAVTGDDGDPGVGVFRRDGRRDARFSTEDGRLLWSFDTVRDYQTVNGVPARGGTLDAPGPVVASGMLLVTSGYPRMGGLPGNVLLGVTVDGK